MHVDVFIPDANLESLVIARMIQLKFDNELFITTEKAEFGFPNEACGIVNSPNILNELELNPTKFNIFEFRETFRFEIGMVGKTSCNYSC